MNAIQRITCASLLLAGLGGGAPAWAADVSREFAVGVNEANATLRGGDVDGALQQYANVRESAPESADLSYNMAVAQYRKGDMAAAEQLFQAAAASENDSLAAKARYNLGNCNYASGLELSQKERPAAIEQLQAAIDSYRSSLKVDSSNADARTNIELASQLIDKLREEEQQEQQQQNQQQDQQQQPSDQQNQDQDQQQQNQQQQNNEQQQEQNSQSSQGEEQNEQQDQQQSPGNDQQQLENDKEQNQDQQQQSQQDQAKQNESKEQQSKDNEPKQQQEAQQNQSQSRQQQDAQARDEQQQSQRPQQQPPQEPSPAAEAEEKTGEQPPQGELTTANEDQAKDGEQQPIAMFDPSKDGEMTQQEAEKMLQAIRDRDMLRRYELQRQEMRRHVPVDRDW